MEQSTFDANYAAICRSYRAKIETLEKAREAELRRLEQNFRTEMARIHLQVEE